MSKQFSFPLLRSLKCCTSFWCFSCFFKCSCNLHDLSLTASYSYLFLRSNLAWMKRLNEHIFFSLVLPDWMGEPTRSPSKLSIIRRLTLFGIVNQLGNLSDPRHYHMVNLIWNKKSNKTTLLIVWQCSEPSPGKKFPRQSFLCNEPP